MLLFRSLLNSKVPLYGMFNALLSFCIISNKILVPLQELKDATEPQQQNQQAQQLQEQQQFNKLVQASQESRQVQGYKFSVPTTPNIKFTSPQQVQHSQMMPPSFSSLSQYNASHPVSFIYFLLGLFLTFL